MTAAALLLDVSSNRNYVCHLFYLPEHEQMLCSMLWRLWIEMWMLIHKCFAIELHFMSTVYSRSIWTHCLFHVCLYLFGFLEHDSLCTHKLQQCSAVTLCMQVSSCWCLWPCWLSNAGLHFLKYGSVTSHKNILDLLFYNAAYTV